MDEKGRRGSVRSPKTSHDCKLVFGLFDSCLKYIVQTGSFLLHLWLMRVVVDYRKINPNACVVMGVLSYCISCCPLSRELNAALRAARPPNSYTGSRGRKAAHGLFIALARRSIHMEEKCPTPISVLVMYLSRVYISWFGLSD